MMTATLLFTPTPPSRVPDLSGLTPPDREELRGYMERLKRAGGFDPRTIRLTLTPDEIDRLRLLEGRVRWAAPMPARRAETAVAASNVGTGGMVLMPKRVADSRRKNATSDLVDAVQRISLALDCPMADLTDPRADPECVCRLEQCTAYLTTIANRLEAQPLAQIGA